MTVFAVLLFATAFAASVWTLVSSVRSQLHRFAELVQPVVTVPVLAPRLTRLTVRSVPARLPARAPLRAAA